jgi:hypothetical protein
MRTLLLTIAALLGMTSFAAAQPPCRPIQWCAQGNWLDKHCWCYQRYGYGGWGEGRWGRHGGSWDNDDGWDNNGGGDNDGGWDDDDGGNGGKKGKRRHRDND